MTKDVTITKQTSVSNVDISPVISEVIEYTKDQAVMKDIKTVLASVPKSDSMDWKLVSGVIMNSLVEWVVENKDKNDVKSLELIQHLQKDIGYLLQRLGLAQQSFSQLISTIKGLLNVALFLCPGTRCSGSKHTRCCVVFLQHY